MRIFLSLLCIVSCIRPIQAQFSLNTHTLPFFDQKNQAHIKFSYYHKHEIHVAYSFGEQWGVNAYWSKGEKRESDNPIFDINDASKPVIGTSYFLGRQRMGLLGFSYFKYRKKNRILDISFGAGYSSWHNQIDNIYTNGTPDENRNFKDVNAVLLSYLQVAIGKHGNRVGWGFSFKATPSLGLKQNLNTVFLEPIYAVNFGWEKLRIELQTGIRLQTNSKITSYRYFHLSGGLSYRLSFGPE